MKKSLAVSFLFIGTVVGAGFSSGREILTFFSGSLALAPISIFACGVVFFLASALLLSLASRVDISDISSLTSHFPPKTRSAFEVLLVLCFLIICALMISGADSVFPSSSGIGISGILLFIAGCTVVFFGNRGLLLVNFVLVPILLIFICGVSVYHLSKNGMPIFDTNNLNYITSVFEGVSYSSMNLLLSAVVLLSACKGLSKKEIILSSGVSASVICTVILLFLFAMNTSSEFLHSEMPILPMARSISPLLMIVGSFAIWIAIFTTFSSSLYTCTGYFKRFCPNPLLRFLLLLAITYPISRLGFSSLVVVFMPAMGVLGIILLIFCTQIYFATKPKKATRKHKNIHVEVNETQ